MREGGRRGRRREEKSRGQERIGQERRTEEGDLDL
jgi:hypothetical protein